MKETKLSLSGQPGRQPVLGSNATALTGPAFTGQGLLDFILQCDLLT